MLEHIALWLSPLLSARADGHRIRLVLDAGSRDVLGQVVVRTRAWWPWPVTQALAVSEGPDASAVFSVERAGWRPHGWNVCDADGRVVALVRGSHLLAPGGAFVASIRPEPDGGTCTGPAGAALAAWWSDRGGRRVEFRPPVRDEPFAKMGLLAAALTS